MTNSDWAFIGLLAFFAIVVYFRAPKIMAKALDQRSSTIRRDLEEAREAKEESKRQLAEFQRRRKAAEDEARQIVEGARREAEMMLVEARQKTEDYVARRTAMAETKIAQAESDAIAEVRSSAVDIAVAAAGRIIAERGSGDMGAQMVERSIQEVRSRLN
ncbi:F0F1 ATP synthase subunit B [Aurantimonas sp. Leaf443]|uniref:F0F1 ATP synthase subunit B n=1 Tax=Aurantimonas sp. Leaf443 TaxID=1736378 RepID=UPI0006F96625|nr:F0F1 ATP synthase subunit B [Aurantimonas sp. Leaf443]KQT88025.1 ATP F0F1 synthase subunit B [Aurantimonas sp. Leaf443]